MYLKRIEMQGFKSFADKTVLEFKPGITTVIGPNGSGKSNISDAIRWVLGEQSMKSLRGAKSEDIIFAGTQARKSLGFAEVSIVIDNNDNKLPIEYSEVTVTRKIYRSGETGYFINKVPCRLKDILELFMDTGIGKDGYSIIGQGKIDEILSNKSEDRRHIFEEAAGIVKFKSRKIEAERKLENTNKNLIRINDIMFTYEERIVPLEEEKLKAEKYLNYAQKLREKERGLILNNLDKIKNELGNQKTKINNFLKDNLEYKEKYKEKREYLSTLKKNIEIIEKNKNNKQQGYFEKKENISKLLSEIELLKERIKGFENYINSNTLELEENEKRIIVIKDKEKKLNDDLENNNNENIILDNKIESLEKKISSLNNLLKDNEREKEVINKDEIKHLKDIANCKNEIILLENQNSSFLENIQLVKDSELGLDKNLKINIKTKQELDEKLNISLEEKSVLEKFIINSLNDEKKLQDDINKINYELNDVNKKMHVLEANREMLKNLESEYEGYSFSVKNLMKEITKGSLNEYEKSCSILGDILKIKKGYEVAVEMALGGAISNIITENENIAKTLIEYLKKKRLGRATFLPLSIIKSKKINLDDSVKNVKGYLCLACEAVNFENKFENVVNNVLGKTIICDNIDNGLILAKKLNYKNRIITLAGDVINSGGALTGGSISQKNLGIMSRKAEIEFLNDKKVKAEDLEW